MSDPVDVTMENMLDRIRRIADATGVEQRALVCNDAAEAGDVGTAANLCRSARAEDGCRFRGYRDFCAIDREGAERRAASERMTFAGVPRILSERVALATPGPGRVALDQTDALKLARAFVAAPRAVGVVLASGETVAFTGSEWALLLLGPAGTGKSIGAAYAVARAGGRWLNARQLASPKVEIEPHERTPLLVLDDLGTEYSGASQFGVERAAALLEYRHGEGARTIVTTNLRTEEMAARYGERLRDRLRQRTRTAILSGPSMRGDS